MSRQTTKVNLENMTVEDGGILYDMEDLYRLSNIYERLCTAEFLYNDQNEDYPLTMEQAYEIARMIRNDMEDICDCEMTIILDEFVKYYDDVVRGDEN